MIGSVQIERLASYRRWLPSDLYFWLKAALLALIAVQAVRLLWAIVTPVGPFGDWRPATPRTLSAEAQSAVLSSVDPFFRSGSPSAPAAGALTDLQLFGTRLGSDGIPGSAILGQSGGDQKSYIVGEEVAPGVKLSSVAFDHVVVDRGGVHQTLSMAGAEAAGAVAQGSPGASIANAFDLSPRSQNGQINGVTIRPGSNAAGFQASGLRPGDVIVAVNGARITSLVDVQQLQSGLAPGARLIVTVERGAQTVPIPLNLPAIQ